MEGCERCRWRTLNDTLSEGCYVVMGTISHGWERVGGKGGEVEGGRGFVTFEETS